MPCYTQHWMVNRTVITLNLCPKIIALQTQLVVWYKPGRLLTLLSTAGPLIITCAPLVSRIPGIQTFQTVMYRFFVQKLRNVGPGAQEPCDGWLTAALFIKMTLTNSLQGKFSQNFQNTVATFRSSFSPKLKCSSFPIVCQLFMMPGRI